MCYAAASCTHCRCICRGVANSIQMLQTTFYHSLQHLLDSLVQCSDVQCWLPAPHYTASLCRMVSVPMYCATAMLLCACLPFCCMQVVNNVVGYHVSAAMTYRRQCQSLGCRYQTVFAPAIHLIQQSLASSAEADPQTPQQKDFVYKTLPALRQAAAAFCKPTDQVVMHPELVWSPFKTLARSLAQQLR